MIACVVALIHFPFHGPRRPGLVHVRYHPAFLLCPYMLTTVPFTASCEWWHYLSLVNHNIPSSFALLIAMPPLLLELTLGQKRTRNSSSSESSSSTVKLVSSPKRLQNRQGVKHCNPAEVLSRQQDRRAKKRSKLTGLATPFYVILKTWRLTQPSSGSLASPTDSEVCQVSSAIFSTYLFLSQDDAELVKQALEMESDSEGSLVHVRVVRLGIRV